MVWSVGYGSLSFDWNGVSTVDSGQRTADGDGWQYNGRTEEEFWNLSVSLFVGIITDNSAELCLLSNSALSLVDVDLDVVVVVVVEEELLDCSSGFRRAAGLLW